MAEALVAAAESSPSRHALALAQCAAAAVDGWSYRETLLHPLAAMPLDSVQLELEPSALDLRYVPACAHACTASKQAGPGPARSSSCLQLPVRYVAECSSQVPLIAQRPRLGVTWPAGVTAAAPVQPWLRVRATPHPHPHPPVHACMHACTTRPPSTHPCSYGSVIRLTYPCTCATARAATYGMLLRDGMGVAPSPGMA
jgi:hypothetical protein